MTFRKLQEQKLSFFANCPYVKNLLETRCTLKSVEFSLKPQLLAHGKSASEVATGEGAYISNIYCYAKVTPESFKFSGSSLAPHQCIFACFFFTYKIIVNKDI